MKKIFILVLMLVICNVAFAQTWEETTKKGAAFYQKGDFKNATIYFEKALPLVEKEFGKNSKNYATSCNNLAGLYNSQGLYAKAEPLYIEAKNIREKVLSEEHPSYATSCNNLGLLYKNQGLYAKAEPLFIEAKNIREKVLGKEHPDYASSCNNLGLLYENQGLYAKAEPLCVEAKNIREKVLGREHPSYAQSYNNLALLYKSQGLYAKAEPLLIEAKKIYEKVLGKEHSNYPLSCNNLAGLYESQGLYVKAEPLYIEAKNIYEKVLGREHPDYATSCNNLAGLYQSQGLYAKAEPLYIEAKNIREKVLGKEHPDYASSCNNLALLYKSQGLYAKAEPLCVEAKNISEKVLGREHPSYAQSYNNLALLYQSQGLYAKAEPLYIEAKNIREKVVGREHPDYATSCNNLAGLYESQGLYAKSEPLMIEAKNIFEKILGKEHPDYAASCSHLAVLYKSQGLYAKAEPLYIEAKNIREKVLSKEHPNYAISYGNLANLYTRQGLYGKAEPLYIEAKNIREKVLGKEHPDYATSCGNLAFLYNRQGLYAKAEPLYIEAKNIQEKVLGKEHSSYATSCNNLAFLYNSQGLYAKAKFLLKEAKNIQERVLGKEHPDYATSCNNLAFLYESQGLYTKAEPLYIEAVKPFLSQIDNNFSTLSEKEKGLFYKSFDYIFENFHIFSTKRYKENPTIAMQVYNNTLATKALLFGASDKMRSRILNSKDEKLIALFEEWKAKKNYLIKVYEMTIADKQKRGIDVPALETEANELEKQLSQKSEIFATLNDKKRILWTDVQKKLKTHEVAIEIIRFRTHIDTTKYMALLIKPESKYPEMIVLENGNELEDKYIKYYKKMNTNDNKFGKTTSFDEHSYHQYWKKIDTQLKGIKKVYLSVDGVYNSLSMNTIFDTLTQKYISEKYDIELLTSTKDLCTRKANTKKEHTKASLIGFPDYNNTMLVTAKNEGDDVVVMQLKKEGEKRFFNGKDIEELPDTKIEIENVEKILQTKKVKVGKFLGKDATEANVKKIQFPEILHIATHGFFLSDINKDFGNDKKMLGMDNKKVFENPLLRSGLLFANAKVAFKEGGDGILTAYEAMNLDLDNTELVVMSACETGLGEVRNGEGVYGLQRAFQTAGAKTILMSLWRVSDEITQELMTLFYKNWIDKQQTKKEAFKNAQNEMKKKHYHPYYWGAFVMVGE